MSVKGGRKKILAIASGGGHWVELLRLRPAFAGHFVVYATVKSAYASQVSGPLHVIPDVTRWDRTRLLGAAASISSLLLRERPDVVISTGALPGFFALVIARSMGIRTIWVDSLANVEALSMSGQKVRAFASLWLTQWAHLASPKGPTYFGSVLATPPTTESAALLPASSGRVIAPERVEAGLRIFATVGAQMPFDRLIRPLDAWAALHPQHSVLAQVGAGGYQAEHFPCEEFLEPAQFEAECARADLIVGHAGTGTFFAAFDRNKPILVMTREAGRRETRNDHQIATAAQFSRRADVEVCESEAGFDKAMARLLSAEAMAKDTRAEHDSDQLFQAIAQYIDAS